MNTMKRPLFLMALLLGCLSQSVSAAEEIIEKSFDVSSGGTLKLNSDQGAIKIRTSNDEKVHVYIEKKAKSKSRLDDFEVSMKSQGDDVIIEGDGGWSNNTSVYYTITVPNKYNLDVRTGGGSIKVDDISGKVKVKTSGGSIKVSNMAAGSLYANTSGGSIKVGDINGDIDVNTSGGSIKVGNITGESKIETSGGSITVESAKGDVTADTAGGSIKVGPVDGNVKVDTSGGSIKVGETTGDVFAETSGGSIKVAPSKGKVTVDTSGGSIRIEGSGGPIVATTSGGSINIEQANGSIHADTSGGAISAEMIATSGDTSVTLKSSGGDIVLYVNESLAASIDAKLKTTRSARRDYQIYSDFNININGDEDRKTAKGDINGGGDRIEISTINGDIHIKKLDD